MPLCEQNWTASSFILGSHLSQTVDAIVGSPPLGSGGYASFINQIDQLQSGSVQLIHIDKLVGIHKHPAKRKQTLFANEHFAGSNLFNSWDSLKA